MALLFFVLSLFESLLPRAGPFQGLASGITIEIGDGIWTLGQWIWTYLEIPKLKGCVRQISGRVLAVVLIIARSFVRLFYFFAKRFDKILSQKLSRLA